MPRMCQVVLDSSVIETSLRDQRAVCPYPSRRNAKAATRAASHFWWPRSSRSLRAAACGLASRTADALAMAVTPLDGCPVTAKATAKLAVTQRGMRIRGGNCGQEKTAPERGFKDVAGYCWIP